MGIVGRFLTSYREDDTGQPGLIQKEDGSVWHLAADGVQTSINPIPAYVSQVRIPHEHILTLPSVPVEVVPAQGAGTIIQPLFAYLRVFVAQTYAMDGGAHWQLFNGTRENSGFVNPQVFVAPGAELHVEFPPFFGYAADDNYLYQGTYRHVADFDGQPLNLADTYNGVPDYTGGDPANYVKVTVVYTVLPLD